MPPMRSRARRAPGAGAHAFSLLELTVVLSIVGVIAAIALPRYGNSLARFQVDSAAGRVAADINFARQRARQTSKAQQVVFDIAGNTYHLPGVPDLANPALVYTVRVAASPFLAKVLSADFGGTPTLEFDGYGTPKSGGSVQVGVGSFTRTIVLDATSGKGVVQ